MSRALGPDALVAVSKQKHLSHGHGAELGYEVHCG